VKLKLLAATAMMAAGTLFGAGIGIGIEIGAPPPPRVVHVRPASPGSGYAWIDGYWYVANHRYVWHDGYWTRPPYAGAIWVGPHHDGHQYFDGYWQGSRGRIEHDHHWDHDHDRDWHH
jgi:WXXGXW repeat (2 copies)